MNKKCVYQVGNNKKVLHCCLLLSETLAQNAVAVNQ